MKKVILISLLMFSFSFGADTLTGNTKLSCEAILCLSTGNRPSECSPSISAYFSINKRKWKDTLSARRSFLQLCPAGDSSKSDAVFTDLRDNIIVNLTSDCSVKSLNTLVSNNRYWDDNDTPTLYKINDTLSSSCKALMSSPYTDINLVYTCNNSNNQWLSYSTWKRGYTYERISWKTYRSLPANEKFYTNDDSFSGYYKKSILKRDCWEIQK